jgi:adenine-specific DNA-methyltransferase
MEKLKMHTPDLTAEKIRRIAELLPNCVTEAQGNDGAVRLVIDFDQLRQDLSDHIADGPVERYRLDWPGKRDATLAGNAPIAKTLRPARNESVDFETTKNLYIEGDNLDALKLLQETYLGKVNLIYIDPPYNTGNDFVYRDDFAEDTEAFLKRSNQADEIGNRLISNPDSNGRFHSDWLTMMYPRLRLARNLLRQDGIIFISIDEGEVHNLRKLCDEVFGESNRVSEIVWKKAYGGGAKAKYVVGHHEYVVAYARDKSAIAKINCPPNPEARRYYKFKDEYFETLGPYRTQPLWTNSMDERENLRYAIIKDGEEIWPERQWQWEKARAVKAQNENKLEFVKSDGGWSVYYKQYLYDEEGNERASKLVSVLDGPYTQAGTDEIEAVFGNGKVFPFPKPSSLIEKFVSTLWTQDHAIILDFFSGSASSAQAVLQFNKKERKQFSFIMVQLPEPCDENSEAFKAGFKTIAEIGKERIRRIGTRLKSESPSNADNQQPELISNEEGGSERDNTPPLDIGFRVLKIESSNMREVYYTPDQIQQADLHGYIDNIRPERSSEDLVFQVLLDWGIALSAPITTETIEGKTVFLVDGNALAACFDTGITDELVKQIAHRKPLRAVFRDASYGNDAVKINVEQSFKFYSPETEVRAI